MQFHTFGNAANPAILLLHGAGLSWWAYEAAANLLATDYWVVLASIDGYGDAANEPFISIEASAQNVICYVQQRHSGHLFALGGLSLGAQIVVEVLRLQPDIATHAIIESALVCGMPGVRNLAAPMVDLSFALIRRRWFSRYQAKALLVPDSLFNQYYTDSLRVTRQTLINTMQSNAAYRIQPDLAKTNAHTMVLVGQKEIKAMRTSARLLSQTIPYSQLVPVPGMRHGELSLQQPAHYVQLLTQFFASAQSHPTRTSTV